MFYTVFVVLEIQGKPVLRKTTIFSEKYIYSTLDSPRVNISFFHPKTKLKGK